MILKDGVNTGAISVVIPLGSRDDTTGFFPPSVISVWTHKKSNNYMALGHKTPPPLNDKYNLKFLLKSWFM